MPYAYCESVPGPGLASPLRRWLALLAGCVTVVVVSTLVIDRPVASYMSAHTRPLGLLRWTVELHRWADEEALVIIVACAVSAAAASRHRPSRLTATLFPHRLHGDRDPCEQGPTAGPETWIDDNPSYIGFIGMSAGWFAIQLWQAWGPSDP